MFRADSAGLGKKSDEGELVAVFFASSSNRDIFLIRNI